MNNEYITKALSVLEIILDKKVTAHQELISQAESILLNVIKISRDDFEAGDDK